MTQVNARQSLINGYREAGFQVVDRDGQIRLRYDHDLVRDIHLRISDDDIAEYAAFLETRDDYEAEPYACSIVSMNYREQLINALDLVLEQHDLEGLRFTPEYAPGISVEVDRASMTFCNYFRFHPDYMALCKDRLFLMPMARRRESLESPIDVRAILARPLTIEIYGMSAKDIRQAVRESTSHIEASLFSLAYELDAAAWLMERWPLPRVKIEQASQQRLARRAEIREGDLRLSAMRFDSDLVRLYESAVSSEVAAHQYLGYYQILLTAAGPLWQETLYDRMRQFLVDPKFRPTNHQLGRLAGIVKDHAEPEAETKVAYLLNQMVGMEAIERYIVGHELDLEEDLYTRRRQLFGERISAATGDRTIDHVARRLDTVYRAIVHDPTLSVHIPFSDTEDLIADEVALARFLAEQVIIATAK
jgi:hypothetical protein